MRRKVTHDAPASNVPIIPFPAHLAVLTPPQSVTAHPAWNPTSATWVAGCISGSNHGDCDLTSVNTIAERSTTVPPLANSFAPIANPAIKTVDMP